MTPAGVLHVPHSSTLIPEQVRPSLLLSDEELRRELLRMTDWFTDELFALPAEIAATVRYPISRLVVDPERFADDAQEVMVARGMGVIYTRTAEGQPLRETPGPEERRDLLERYYEPHHRMLTETVRAAMEACGRCLIVDCHSFPSVALPCDLDPSPGRPDFCLGTDAFHTPGWLVGRAVSLLEAGGRSVTVDRPYSGALVPATFYGKEPNVSALMIEVNRRLYMDEASGAKLEGFGEIAELVRGVVMALFEKTLGD